MLLLRRLGEPSPQRRGASLEFWGSNSSSGMTSSQRAPRKPERQTQSWGRLQEPRFWQGGWHTGLIQWLVLFAVVHPGQHCPPQTFLPVSRPRGWVEAAAPDLCGVPTRWTAGAARARGAGCCWRRGLLLRICAGGWTRRGCCARGGLLASTSAGLLGFPQPSWARSAGSKPGTAASCSRNRLYTLAVATAGWLPPGRRSRFVSLPAGSYLPTGSLWA